jgi:3-oxoacyl-[acyl-carrier-protein] synthase-1
MSRASEMPEWPYFDREEHDEHFLFGHPAMGVAAGFQGIARLLKLGTMAIGDLGRSVDLASLHRSRIGVVLVLAPEHANEGLPTDGLLAQLCKLVEFSVDERNLRTSFDGRIGVAMAMHAAQQQLISGDLDHVLIGAVDSLLVAPRIGALIEAGEVKTLDNPVGVMPGEAAAFVLLERAGSARGRGGEACAEVRAATVAAVAPTDREPGAEDKPRADPGKALAEVMLGALRASGRDPSSRGTLYADLNGATPRALDLSSALVKVSPVYPLGDWQQAFPAISFGETGAASGLLASCMAVHGLVRGYARGEQALVIMCDEFGGKAALPFARAAP